MGPADQQLGGDDRSDTGFGEQRRPGRVLRDEDQQLDVELGGLGAQEPDPGGDRSQGSDGDSVLEGGLGGAGELVDPVELLWPVRALSAGAKVLRGDDDQALQFVDRLGPAHQNPLSGD